MTMLVLHNYCTNYQSSLWNSNKTYIHRESRKPLLSITTLLRAARPRNRNSIPGMGNIFLSLHSARTGSEDHTAYPINNAAGTYRRSPALPLRSSMCTTVSPFPRTSFFFLLNAHNVTLLTHTDLLHDFLRDKAGIKCNFFIANNCEERMALLMWHAQPETEEDSEFPSVECILIV